MGGPLRKRLTSRDRWIAGSCELPARWPFSLEPDTIELGDWSILVVRRLIDAKGGIAMSLSIAEALEQVELEPGRIYSCQVKGHWVELRVMEPGRLPMSTLIDESDIMLDPWVELPRPKPTFCVTGSYGPPPPPHIPEIPSDEDD
jgi:hypothetical protein